MIAILFSLALVVAQDEQPPPTQAAPETPAAARTSLQQAQENPDRVVCRRETTTGTRFVKRTCRTVAEWEEITDQSQQSFREVQSRPVTPLCPPSGC